MITLESILKFIRDNDGYSKVLRGWTEVSVAQNIVDAIEDKAFIIDVDEYTSEINGIVLATPCCKDKILHITAILIRKGAVGVLPRFIAKGREMYPEYTLEANRRGKLKLYKDTSKMLKKLENISSTLTH